MSCFPCFSSQRSKRSNSKRENGTPSQEYGAYDETEYINQAEKGNIQAQTFTFRELATATKNFRQECLLGEGGFGRVYKGTLAANGQVVAVKQLDRNGMQGNKEFLVEVLMLSQLHHENLVNLIGYCADGDQRLLVYEFMSGGSLEDCLLENEPGQKPLDWFTRMKIAYGAARGLEYLHDKANPPVIYRDLKSSNILLDEGFNPKLSDFGLAKLGLGGDKANHVSSRVMGTYGYCAPEYARSGHLTLKSDVYSYGVVLLELITGRRTIDTTKPNDEQNLVAWAQPLFRDPKKFPDMADPLLEKHFPEKDLNQAVAIAAMCLQEEAGARPLMSDVVTALSFLSTVPTQGFSTSPPAVTSPSNQDSGSSDDEDGDNSDNDSDGDDKHQSSVSRKSSKRSRNRSSSSSHKSSIRSRDRSVSSSHRSSKQSQDGSVSSHKSSVASYEHCGILGLSNRSSRKSSDGSASLSHEDSMGSQDRSASIGPSQSGSEYFERSISKESNGNVSLSRDSSGGSQDGSIHEGSVHSE